MRPLFLAALLTAPAAAHEAFRIDEGNNANLFYRDADVAAHAVVSSRGRRPRIVVAFPAGNSGVGLWFDRSPEDREWFRVSGPLRRVAGSTSPVSVSFDVEAATGELRAARPVLDTVRAIRDFKLDAPSWRADAIGQAREAIAAATGPARAAFERGGITLDRLDRWLAPRVSSDAAGVEWTREAAGSGAQYRLALRLSSGTVTLAPDGGFRLSASSGSIRFSVEAGVGYRALEPLPPAALLNEKGHACVEKAGGRLGESLRNLAFLSYREKFLAGSWQYLTYFGRDTLITARVLSPVIDPKGVEAVLRGVLDRLADDGSVAHEEDVGDQAAIRRLQTLVLGLKAGESSDLLSADASALDKPIYDYKMIDGEFLLPLVAADYAQRVDSATLRGFLDRPSARGESYGAALARAAGRVAALARPYADARANGEFGWALARRLVALRPGVPVGDWRDSTEGLGGGRYPSSVNAGLVAPALRAYAAAFKAAEAAGSAAARSALAEEGGPDGLGRIAAAWDRAYEHFRVALAPSEVRARLEKYLASFPPPERAALENVSIDGVTVADFVSGKATPAPLRDGLRFWALSLDADGRPIAVESSDVGFALAEGKLSPAEAAEAGAALALPFPVGLASPVGTLVANPAFSSRPDDYARFGRDKYHGTVAWSWPIVVARLGLRRQLGLLAPNDAARPALQSALDAAQAGERAVGALRASELWSWTVSSGTIVPAAFGAGATDETESNALQLWSTLNLSADCP